MNFKYSYLTDIGRRRSKNQDSLTVVPELGLFIVADGMGGHQGGEIASAMAIETIEAIVMQEETTPRWNPKNTIIHAISEANRAIFTRSRKEIQLQGMGTTTTAILLKDNLLTIGHVGDSRSYFIRPNQIWQLTRDHSFVQEKIRAGLITREQAKTDKMKNVITRSVGFESKVEVETYEMTVQPGDIFLICSDGLSGLVEDLQILEIIQNKMIGPHHFDQEALDLTVKNLVDLANETGGDDNISAVLFQFEKSES